MTERPDGTAAEALYSPRPELRSSAAEGIGREGIVTVWDEHGRYVGCLGVETWKTLLGESVDVDGPDVHDDPSWSPESAARFGVTEVVREQTAVFHDWHKLIAYPETCEACRYRAALEAILDTATNATVLNVQFIAKEALGGTE